MEERRKRLRDYSASIAGDTLHSHILPLPAGENSRAVEMSRRFREAGFWVMPIRYPTVPRGSARVRISLNAALSREDIRQFIETCANIG